MASGSSRSVHSGGGVYRRDCGGVLKEWKGRGSGTHKGEQKGPDDGCGLDKVDGVVWVPREDWRVGARPEGCVHSDR